MISFPENGVKVEDRPISIAQIGATHGPMVSRTTLEFQSTFHAAMEKI
jgi:hypothetical protein